MMDWVGSEPKQGGGWGTLGWWLLGRGGLAGKVWGGREIVFGIGVGGERGEGEREEGEPYVVNQ